MYLNYNIGIVLSEILTFNVSIDFLYRLTHFVILFKHDHFYLIVGGLNMIKKMFK